MNAKRALFIPNVGVVEKIHTPIILQCPLNHYHLPMPMVGIIHGSHSYYSYLSTDLNPLKCVDCPMM